MIYASLFSFVLNDSKRRSIFYLNGLLSSFLWLYSILILLPQTPTNPPDKIEDKIDNEEMMETNQRLSTISEDTDEF